MTSNTKQMAKIAVMVAVMCVLGPMTIPIGVVPVSLTPLSIFLAVYILGMKDGTIAFLVYLLIGVAGVPVLSGASGGLQKLVGPTGGYLIGFIFMSLLAGFFIDKFYHNIYLQFLGMCLGLLICYILGTTWLSISTGMSAGAAIAAGVTPFVIFDMIKAVIAIGLGRVIRKRLAVARI